MLSRWGACTYRPGEGRGRGEEGVRGGSVEVWGKEEKEEEVDGGRGGGRRKRWRKEVEEKKQGRIWMVVRMGKENLELVKG